MPNKKGFSLIEVLISLVILSLLMISLYALVDTSQKRKDRITLEDREILQAQLAFNRIDADFSQIYSPLYFSKLPSRQRRLRYPPPSSDQFPSATEEGDPIPTIENPDQNTLIFMSSANRRKIQDIKQSRLLWVRYTLRKSESEDSPLFDLIRISTANDPFAQRLDWEPLRKQVLLDGVESLDFQFWNQKRKEWEENLRNLPKGQALAALKVILRWKDDSGKEYKNTRVFRPLWPSPAPRTKNKVRRNSRSSFGRPLGPLGRP